MLRPTIAVFAGLLAAPSLFAAPAPMPLLPLPALGASAQDGTLPDLKDEVDVSVRWLRATQNPETGAYGGGVEGTAWTLYALAKSPRKYTRVDGPFMTKALSFLVSAQAEDGSIADEGTSDEARLQQTRAAAAALSVLVSPETAPALGKAAVWLADHGVDSPEMDEMAIPDKVEKLGFELLARRKPDGSYEGPKGAVIATSRAIVALSSIKKRLQPAPAVEERATALPSYHKATRAEIDAAVLRGARFLLAAGPGARWGAPGQPDVGITALVVSGLQAVPEPRPGDIQATIDDAQAWIASHQKEDGAIHQGQLANYVTSASVMALAPNPKYKETVAKARDWIIRIQADEGEGYSEGDLYYGGIGYGSDERPDLSNLQMALEALVAAGETKESKSIQNALKYLERCQNRSESNDVAVTRDGIVIKSGDDGGGYYAPDESKAGYVELGDGTKIPRSYGSMSYALLKGFVFAGLTKEDPRVAAVFQWLSDNYTLDVNPGFPASAGPVAPYQGLYYYFHTMGKALDILGVDAITDGAGVEHDWRAELAGRLTSMQAKDGSWVNENAPRWWEGNPLLATSYALETLAATRKAE
ncbi:Prenyltransferase and squalene oxidase repeat protein [Planctomycetes bacterium Poly30]|uniref:Prenyltransferase and squalene oxidase repeat protein n=1 Tax=Saltatorellus ferox TaxID=2528018 RepID=A0A518EV56_9BACT|nr:Prenyltransferase and squalene oxidase repeat protein [Planctomycetes bacterium Poly30]